MRRVVTARCGGLAVGVALLAASTAVLAQAPAPPAGLALLAAGGTLDLRWVSADGQAAAAPPALDADTAYVPMRGGRLVAFDLDSGRVRWAVAAETGWAPAVGDGRVFAALADGMRAYDAATGRVLWQRPLPAPAAAPPYWDTGWLVVSLENGALAALRAADGETLWTATLGAPLQTAPAPALDALYLGLADGRVVALALATGQSLWSRRLEGAVTGVLGLDDQLVVGTAGRTVHSLDLRSGRTRWRWRVGGAAVGAAAADDRRIYFVAYDHLVRAVDRRSGNLRWRQALGHRPAGSPLVAGGFVLVPSLASEIAAFETASGVPAPAIAGSGEVSGDTRLRLGGPAAGTRLLAVSSDGRLMAFAPRVEPAPAPLDVLPGTAVAEPAAQPAAPATPPGRDRR
ncbi:MAG: PQQ-binding-like beta-propeller repeat protein [Vicinamibacterales bacterium]